MIFLLLLPFSVATAQTRSNDAIASEREVDYFYLHAISLIEQEQYDAAYDVLEHCRALQPTSSAVLFELVNIYRFLGQNEKAFEILSSIVENNPDNYQFRMSLVQYLINRHNTDALIEAYEKIVEDFPEKSNNYITLYELYSGCGDYSRAIEMLEKYGNAEGETEYIALQKCRIYMMMGDGDAALAVMNGLVAENPDDNRLRVYLAKTYYGLGNTEKAVALYDEVLATDPDNYDALFDMVSICREEGKDSLYICYAERVVKSEKLSESEDEEMSARLLYSYVAWRIGRGETDAVISFIDELLEKPNTFDIAADVLFSCLKHDYLPFAETASLMEKVLAYEPENYWAHIGLLRNALEIADYDEVIHRCEVAVYYHPEVLSFYYYGGLACLRLGRMEEALATFEVCVERCGETADTEGISDVYELLGDVYHDLGYIDKAFCAYDSALVYNGNNITVLNNYAYYLALENRELDRALAMSLRTLQERPDDAVYVDTYAWILFRLGRYEEAKMYADRLLANSDELSAVEYHHCGDIYAMCGDVERAVGFWTMAYDRGDDSKLLKRKIKKKKYISDVKKQ